MTAAQRGRRRLIDARETALRGGVGRVRVRDVRRIVPLVVRLRSGPPSRSAGREPGARERGAADPRGRARAHAPAETFARKKREGKRR